MIDFENVKINSHQLVLLNTCVERACGRWDTDAVSEFLCACQFDPVMNKIRENVFYNRQLATEFEES